MKIPGFSSSSRQLPCWLTLICCVLLSGVGRGAELDLDELVKRHTAAMGGLEKIQALRTLKMTGTMVLGGGQMQAATTSWVKRPNSTRSEVVVAGKQIIQAFEGATAWTINPMNGTTEAQVMPPDQAAALADLGDSVEGPLIGFREKGRSAELLGKKDVEGASAYEVRVQMKSGRVQTLFVSADSFLTVKIATAQNQGGQMVESEILLKDYKPVEGVMLPHVQEIRANGRVVAERRIERIEANVAMEDTLFRLPPPVAPVSPGGVPVRPKPAAGAKQGQF